MQSLTRLPKRAKDLLRQLISQIRLGDGRVLDQSHPAENVDRSPTFNELQEVMRTYQVHHLVTVSPEDFEKKIREFLELQDSAMEGFEDPPRQRDLSIRFHWGHDHDFGSFKLSGLMKDRHIRLLTTFIDGFSVLPKSLHGKRVLDVGCWTGGTSLLLAALGAEVLAIEEVRKYAQAATYLRDAFGIENLDVQCLSLFDLVDPKFHDAFDFVLLAGVLYHVTDPVLALRIMFNSLRPGGSCLVETAALPSKGQDAILRYEGPQAILGGDERQLSRSGWNWFIPNSKALTRMMYDVGFAKVIVPRRTFENRQYAVGIRESHVDILRSGLSLRTVR